MINSTHRLSSREQISYKNGNKIQKSNHSRENVGGLYIIYKTRPKCHSEMTVRFHTQQNGEITVIKYLAGRDAEISCIKKKLQHLFWKTV